ncbi:lytic murein transglycosylase [Micromonospora sp. NPDC094482]|uniref:lytic transglycosylase domain-containing protein n=1 Tax=Micromonospora sp. NPDC094482 TaxID=3155081 RepID=UPI00331D300D
MADGEDRSTLRPLRPAAPLDGPLAESGAAPEPGPRQVPRPRRPWLRANSPTEPDSASSDASAGTATTGSATAGAAEGTGGATDQPTAESAANSAEPGAGDPATETATEAGTATSEAKTESSAGTTDPKAEAGASTGDPTNASGGPKTETDAATTDPKTEAGAGSAGAKTEAAADSAGAKADAGTTAAPKADADPAGTSPKAAPDGATAEPATGKATVDGPAGRTRRHRVPFAHAVRLGPRRAAVSAARATRAWSRRPSGRLTLPGLFLLVLVAATAAAGALLVPAAVRAPRPVAVDGTTAPTVPPAGVAPTAVPSGLPGGVLPTTPLPTGVVPPTGPVIGVGGRPADALAAWAQQVGPKVGISPVAMQAYGYAELVLAQTNRSCALSWTTLAAIGFVESSHGQANGAQLGQDGRAVPEIIGLPLDGRDGRMRIVDTDRGQLDRDTTFDRAIGPMQFIPTTWQEIGADADNDGRKDPHDLDDAALAAGNYLCKNGRNLSIPGDWWNAILSYNDVRRYAQDVYNTANRYGQTSRT